jgi:hypothetical protein
VCVAGTSAKPFDVAEARSQHYSVGHSGECASKCCGAPWHVHLVTHRHNTMSGQWVRGHRGKHSNMHRYGGDPPNVEANPVVSGMCVCVVCVGGWLGGGWRAGACARCASLV